MQTIFIILVCNNQLLELIEKELIWILGFVPGLSFTTHGLIANLQKIKDKYLAKPAVSNIKVEVFRKTIEFYLQFAFISSPKSCSLSAGEGVELLIYYHLECFHMADAHQFLQ